MRKHKNVFALFRRLPRRAIFDVSIFNPNLALLEKRYEVTGR
jgi:hypothetical protein